MKVMIINPPKGLDLVGTVEVVGEHIGKKVVVDDEERCVLEIKGGNDDDIRVFNTVAGITVERIQEEPQPTT